MPTEFITKEEGCIAVEQDGVTYVYYPEMEVEFTEIKEPYLSDHGRKYWNIDRLVVPGMPPDLKSFILSRLSSLVN